MSPADGTTCEAAFETSQRHEAMARVAERILKRSPDPLADAPTDRLLDDIQTGDLATESTPREEDPERWDGMS